MFASLLLVAAALSAQAPDTTFAIRAGDRLRVSTREGDITVRSWNRNEVEVRSGDRDDDDRSRGVRVSRSGSVITVDAAGGWMGGGDLDVVIRMPATVSLSANSVEGDITVDGIAAPVSVETVEGDVLVRGARGNVTASAVDGTVDLRDTEGNISASSVNDDVLITSARGRVAAEAVNGDVMVLDSRSDAVSLSSVNGDLVFSGPLSARGQYDMSTHNGDIVLGVQSGASASVTVSTFQGDFESDHQIQVTSRNDRRFSFSLGGGSATVKLDSFQGTIHLTTPEAVARLIQDD
ncbi:MAG TPA: DUF4097 family beta strand repeat-containing protein [Gemmatimonadales bacterium]|nr:DUF4097 family beta strand repeat-containing protein [Gemmatimonadales bacterium]